MNLHHLSIFAAVAETRSFSRGSEKLMISQPAVSKQIQSLEKSLGTALFDRHGKGVRLTAAGELLAGYASRIFKLSDEAEHAMRDLAGLRAGRVAVGAGPTVGIYMLPEVMVRFRRGHPQIRLHAETADPGVLRQRLLDGLLDMAITESPIASSELQSTTLLHDVLVPIAAGASELSRKLTVSKAEFCRQPFVARETTSGEKSLVERTLAARGLEVTPVLTVGSTEAIKQAVIAGLGVAIVSRLAVRTEIAAGLLVELPIKGLRIRYPIYLLRVRGKTLSVGAAEFLRLVNSRA